ncbi:hypothetical protein Naga_100264g7 [Nannochloropsis gaditana]|uniref:Uncharacterized protein n=1 Tax=Nannochloropsis gaditana TaxID=72520 RepID=W7U6H9_9STRA|nr:hypothetical protein Naga_100264g7 [Nannochloropsis gaditana]
MGGRDNGNPIPTHGIFNYTAVGGTVPFTANDLGPAAPQWRARSDLSGYRYSPIACHVCSYLCFTAPVVGDEEDRCQFTLDWNTTAKMQDRCPHWM